MCTNADRTIPNLEKQQLKHILIKRIVLVERYVDTVRPLSDAYDIFNHALKHFAHWHRSDDHLILFHPGRRLSLNTGQLTIHDRSARIFRYVPDDSCAISSFNVCNVNIRQTTPHCYLPIVISCVYLIHHARSYQLINY